MSAVYVGGLLPAFFGIAGTRHRKQFSGRMNSHWIAPLPDETPGGSEQFSLEPRAYWG